MKELNKKQKDIIEIVSQQQKKTELVLDGLLNPKNNHIVFEVCQDTKTAIAAEYENSKQVNWFSLNIENKKHVVKNKGCIYVSALNFKNLKKKLLQHGIDDAEHYTLIKRQHESGAHLEVKLMQHKQ